MSANGVWVYTNGSILEGEHGAVALFNGAAGAFREVRLMAKNGPLRSVTDAKLLGMRLNLEHLFLIQIIPRRS